MWTCDELLYLAREALKHRVAPGMSLGEVRVEIGALEDRVLIRSVVVRGLGAEIECVPIRLPVDPLRWHRGRSKGELVDWLFKELQAQVEDACDCIDPHRHAKMRAGLVPGC